MAKEGLFPTESVLLWMAQQVASAVESILFGCRL